MNPFPNEAAARAYLGKIADPMKRQAARAHLVQYGYHLDDAAPIAAPVVHPAPQPAPSVAPRVDEVQAPLPPPRPPQRPAPALPGVLTLTLPWCPSINHYWRHLLVPCKPVKPGAPPYRVQVVISAEGKAFRREVLTLIRNLHGPRTPPGARLAVALTLCPPNRRVIDIDNRVKAVLDAATHAQVWADDSLIDELHVSRGEVRPGGCVLVTITPLTQTLFGGHL